MTNRPTVTPRQAAALDRLLAAYVGNDDADPGMDDLRTLHRKVGLLEMDHGAYELPAPPEGASDDRCGACPHLRGDHHYTDLICTVKLDQHGFRRCGCAYRPPA